MVLSVTGSPVLIGNDDIGHIEFLPTDMDAVDAGGKPTGEKLHIARTLHTHGARNRINDHLLARGLTHASLAMQEDGAAYVVGRFGRKVDSEQARNPVMEAGHDTANVISVKDVQVFPGSALMLASPNFAMHPAVNMTWYEGASQAAAIEDAHKRATGQDMRVRMIRDAEYTRFVTWDGKYSEAEVIERAHLHREGVNGTASVVGEAAAFRTTEEGFVDSFGNVYIWTDGVSVRPATGADMSVVTRIIRGASWLSSLQNANVGFRDAMGPSYLFGGYSGVRWVAVFR